MRSVDNFFKIVLILVLVYLVVVHWQGAKSVLRQSGASTAGINKTLQGR